MPIRDPKYTHVAVLMGGWSAEREVSLSTGEGCADALRRSGFQVTPIDVKRNIAEVLADLRPDVAFNALHGKWGEDGCMSAILETMEIPYTHSGVRASAIAMDKVRSKILFTAAGIPVAEGRIVDLEVAATQHPLPLPYVLKPQAQGSSVGVHIVDHSSNGPAAIVLEERELFGDQVLAERFIPGKELTCAVMGDVALGVIDILPAVGFYDYKAKYAPGGSVHVLPADIPREVYRKVQQYALAAHQALGCRGVSRADFRYDDTPGGDGELILLEVNTQPGMTGTSLVPELAAHAGHSYEDLVTWMVNDASVNR
ncbi:D-alanine--D-alanine ligase [Nordella sp. HKS 07]|uniref:D-alanine--D-alanine ligase n=1 Tax=Nordella sp. HKS 07 TaxID=2712222 RepID=UPI0013E10C1C|nr:D-alanine--D-alanine ligase [Nordella sp. HKS 07]QIG51952.1 D-alanine--D-alanine ligase [Nordella sp. HKS 07]